MTDWVSSCSHNSTDEHGNAQYFAYLNQTPKKQQKVMLTNQFSVIYDYGISKYSLQQ